MTNKHYELYKERLEEFSKLICNNESCRIVCLENRLFIKQTFIDIADREIERLGEKKMEKDYSVEAQDIDWSKHDIHNKALNQQISYWNKAKKLITNHE